MDSHYQQTYFLNKDLTLKNSSLSHWLDYEVNVDLEESSFALGRTENRTLRKFWWRYSIEILLFSIRVNLE